MNWLALIFLGVATRKLSCASWRLATTASATPTPTSAATTRHKSVSTSRSVERPPMLRGLRGPLTPLHLLTRLPGSILEHAGPLQPSKDGALTSNSSTSWRPGSRKSTYASANYVRLWCKTSPLAGTEVRPDAVPGTSTAASSRTKGETILQSSAWPART